VSNPTWDTARFYAIDGVGRLPSVTTILDVINKPALGPWYAKQERLAALAAVKAEIEVLLKGGPPFDPDVLATLPARWEKRLSAEKAADKAKRRSADVGTQVHKWVE
jgi:hypothetical protein